MTSNHREKEDESLKLTRVCTQLGNQNKNAVWQSAMMGIGNDENETREYDLFQQEHLNSQKGQNGVSVYRKEKNEEWSNSEASKDILGLK